MSKKVIVAGGGASGMCAAIYAARNGAEVTILEKNSVLGKKLSMTGNGRCNLTNLDMRSDCYNDAAKGRMKDWLNSYGAMDVIDFFKSLGVVTVNEDGYIYPKSGQAFTVVKAMENELNRLGVQVVFDSQVKKILHSGGEMGAYEVKTSTDSYFADSVIIATGSLSGPKSTMSTGDGYYICQQLGMSVKDRFPALVGFKCAENELLPKQGVRAQARITFLLGAEEIASEEGELQITSDGISGIPVMQASGKIIRFVSENKPIDAMIDFFADYDDEEFAALKKQMLDLKEGRTLEEFLQGFANSNITDMILCKMKLGKRMKMKNISDSMCECILDNFRALKLRLSESYGYIPSQVTSGGVSIGDISDDMSSKSAPGIYCIGELLDVDGRCGGYNLQFAFTSGSLAGTAAAR
ncbi:MAG: aminoacetone oxidase family FAD-binding enzyme [Butyrivibrio sp.]|nr:aminoacetone oxidase family FAD-binding enzyme [Butyrivibrio sp.]